MSGAAASPARAARTSGATRWLPSNTTHGPLPLPPPPPPSSRAATSAIAMKLRPTAEALRRRAVRTRRILAQWRPQAAAASSRVCRASVASMPASAAAPRDSEGQGVRGGRERVRGPHSGGVPIHETSAWRAGGRGESQLDSASSSIPNVSILQSTVASMYPAQAGVEDP